MGAAMCEVKPKRIRLSRAKGFNLQAASRDINGLECVNVARPSRFGNPFTVSDCRDAGFKGTDRQIAKRVVEAFRVWLLTDHWRVNWSGAESESKRKAALDGLPELRGKNLACWCPLDAPCHADVLLEEANRDE